MVLPVTGPHQFEEYLRNAAVDGLYDYHLWRNRWRQKRPIDQPLPFGFGTAIVTARTGVDTYSPSSGAQSFSSLGPHGSINDLQSVAYDRLKGQISENAQLAVSLLELRESYGMVASRAFQLFEFTNAVRRRQFDRAWEVLRRDMPRGWRPRAKKASDQWLEYSFGWKPLVQDIGNAVQVLQEPIKNVFIKASASNRNLTVLDRYPPPMWGIGWKYDFEVVAVRYGMEVGVDNPNLWLANQLGFVNPMVIGWEIVPFSFVLDYFANIQQFLSLSTDFLGLTTKNSYTTFFQKGRVVSQRGEGFPGSSSSYTFCQCQRATGITTPSLTFRPTIVTGLGRAANMIALLVGGMKSLR